MTSVLRVTDGTNVIDLLEIKGWLLKDWRPATPEPKGGGVFRSSPIADGRKLVSKKFNNVFDTFHLVGSESNQDMMILMIQELERLLEKATDYWTTDWQREPVWLEISGPYETEIRYATIVDYRLTDFNNPFKMPFFSCAPATETMLVIEHLIWQSTPPGDDATCVQVSSQGAVSTAASVSVETSALYEDCNSNQTTLAMSYPDDLLLGYSGGVLRIGLWFENVVVANAAQILYATLTLTASDAISDDPFTMYLRYEAPSATSGDDFDQSYLEYNTRNWIYSSSNAIGDTVLDTAYVFDVTSAVQNIVDDADWASGDNIAFHLSPSYWGAIENYRQYYAGKDAAGNPPTLAIYYTSSSIETGADPTCENEVYVGNKQNKAPINRCYSWNADGAVQPYSNNLIGVATPFYLLPNVGDLNGEAPEVGDRLMFCSKISEPDSGPFSNIIFDIGTGSVGISGTWYYWNGAATELDICGNIQLTETGVTQVVFEPPEDWITNTFNGVEGYWVWYEVDSVSTPTLPTQGDGVIYTVLNPYIDIDDAQVGGDIPALARILYDLTNCNGRPTSKIIMGLRSLDRGSNFSAYLNASDEQNPVGITYNVLAGALATAAEAPSGRNHILTAANTTLTNIAYWELNAIANHYYGSYHAFLRVRQVDGTAGNVSFRIFTYSGGTSSNFRYSDIGYTRVISEIHAVDLGRFTIASSYRMRADETINLLSIGIQLENPNGEDVEIYDLVLIPSDEWIGAFGDAEPAYDGYRYDFDAATHPRAVRSSLNWVIDDDTHSQYTEVVPVLSGVPILQANSDQRLWFTQMYENENYAYIETIGKVRLQCSNRYLLARGAR